jgi:hypothetical protein
LSTASLQVRNWLYDGGEGGSSVVGVVK